MFNQNRCRKPAFWFIITPNPCNLTHSVCCTMFTPVPMVTTSVQIFLFIYLFERERENKKEEQMYSMQLRFSTVFPHVSVINICRCERTKMIQMVPLWPTVMNPVNSSYILHKESFEMSNVWALCCSASNQCPVWPFWLIETNFCCFLKRKMLIAWIMLLFSD